MKKGNLKGNFLFIVGISVMAIILFIVGFVAFYSDSSRTFSSDGYIIKATENSSKSYSFADGTKYKNNISNDISFIDADSKKSVSVNPASFVHYSDGSLSYLKNGALIDLDDINKDYVPFYNISDKFLIKYSDGNYSITNDTKSLSFSNWIGRISDDKFIVVGKNSRLRIPGVTTEIVGDYFELLFMTDGVVKIDNKDVSYQVTAQGSYIYVGDNITIDLGENKVLYNNSEKLLLSQITINGNENINLDDDEDTSGVDTSGVDTSGVGGSGTSGVGGSGVGTSGTGGGDGSGDGTSSTDATGNGTSSTSTSGSDSDGTGGDGSGNSDSDINARIELIKLDATSTFMSADLQMNFSDLISGDLVAYLTNVSTGERIASVGISKEDGTFSICSVGTDCYSFDTVLKPSAQYLLSIIDSTNNRQYFQKLFNTADLGVKLVRDLAASDMLVYNIEFDTGSFVSQVDLYLYAAEDITGTDGNVIKKGTQIYGETGVKGNSSIDFQNLSSNSSYKIVLKNISVCDSDNNCVFDEDYEISRTDSTLKKTPTINSINVKKNVSNGTFDLSAIVSDEDNAITRYVYTICTKARSEEEEEDCFTKEKNDGDALTLTVGPDLESGETYYYSLNLLYNDGLMDREVRYNGTKEFSMESAPYFEISDKSVTATSASLVISLHDASCTVNLQGRNCKNTNGIVSNDFVLKYYKFTEGEEKTIKTYNLNRRNFKYNEETGLYYISTKDSNIDLSGLVSETRYAVKIYGTYVLNGEVYNNVQIGDEMYFDTASTGDLKLEYSSNDSDEIKVINYNAGFSGGIIAEDDEEASEKLENSLGSLNRITFTLYAGSYQDDSESNNRAIGNLFTITGNETIRKMFCNANLESNTCNIKYNFTNASFGLESLEALMTATAATNYCGKNVNKCLAPKYTIVVTEATDSIVGGNDIKIDKNTYTYSITPEFYVTAQLKNANYNTALNVSTIVKDDFVDSEDESGYNFDKLIDNIGELNNKNAFVDNLNGLNKDTVVGLNVETSMVKSFIDTAYTYDKVVTNYYICYKDSENCKDEAVSKYSVESADVAGDSFSNSSHEFYLNDSNFIRGKSYTVMYELEFTNNDGVRTYSSEYTTVNIDIKKQEPNYVFYIKDSNEKSIKYGYRITDIDKAINENDYYFYYKIGDEKTYTKDDSTSITMGNDIIRNVTFPICEESCNNVKYSIALKANILGNSSDYLSIVDTVFEGKFVNGSDDRFSLVQFDNDNQLYIILDDTDGLASRNVLYQVMLDVGNEEKFNRVYLNSKLNKCDSSSDDGICSKYNGSTFRYISIDYADISEHIEKEVSVNIKTYFDSGLIGMEQEFTNGLIFKSSISNKYLNFYGAGSNVTESVDDSSNGIYRLKNGNTIPGDIVEVYNALKNSNTYSNRKGTEFTNVEQTNYTYSFSKNGVTWVRENTTNNRVGFDPKVIAISDNMQTDNNNFKFYSIIPKVTVNESNTINSIGLTFSLTGVSQSTLDSGQIKRENGNYYLYVNLYDADKNKINNNPNKVKITCTESGCSGEINYDNLDVDTTYYYDIFINMKSENNSYSYVQVFDGKVNDDYVVKTYETKTLGVTEILSKVEFSVKASDYTSGTIVNNSISDKTIRYNINVKNGNNYKVRLSLYHDESMINFNTVNGIGGECSSNNCYVEIKDDTTHSISNGDNIKSITFNNNNYVFGDGYYTLKVEAIPYYSNSSNYDESKKLILYDKVLNTTDDKSIDVHELNYATFNTISISSGYNTTYSYYVLLKIPSISDPDYVLKNSEYFVNLLDSSGNVVYYVSNEGSGNNRKAVMRKENSSGEIVNGDLGFVLKNTTAGNVQILFPDLISNSGYSVEISYETYRNNVSIIDDENAKKIVDPYTDSIYTPVSAGIIFGNINATKVSDTSFKLDYVGGNYLESVKCISFTSRLLGTNTAISGTLSDNSLFTKSGSNYSLLIGNSSSNNFNLNFATKGTYNITMTYYTNLSCSNDSKVNSHTSVIVVE